MTIFHEHRVNNFDEMSKQHASILMLCQAYTRAMHSTHIQCCHRAHRMKAREKK